MSETSVPVVLENHTIRIQNIEKQLAQLHQITESIQGLSLSVNKLATNMEIMAGEQKDLTARLKTLEMEPADNWKHMKHLLWTSALSAIIGAAIVFLVTLVIR